MKRYFCLLFSVLCLTSAFSSDAINNLSNIEQQKITYQQANYARDGSNYDGTNASNFLDTIPKGLVNNVKGIPTGGDEYVIAHIKGPAVLERIWSADVKNNEALLNFYFDGEIVPRFSASIAQIFYQKSTLFDDNLAKNVFESSGGNTLYASLLIKNDLIITSETNMYYQVSYTMLPKDTMIASWTNTNDELQSDLFALSGTYPKSNSASLNIKNIVHSIPAQGKVEIFNSNRPGTVEGIEMNIKDLNFDYAERIYDEGNVRKGISFFKMKINGQADSLYLVNRMNKNSILGTLKNCSANVFVDNKLVGTWFVEDYRDFHFWEDERFYIPKSFYQGKNSINISVQYLSGEIWNEFKYQTICDQIITDELDIKNTASQNSHGYIVTGVQGGVLSEFTSKATARYRSPRNVQRKNQQILDSLYISVYYDGATLPSIHAPIGLFFGAGTNDAAYMNALLMGNHQKTYFNYMTMPYWENVKIELENFSSVTIDSIFNTILYTNNDLDKNAHGYLKAYVGQENKLANDPTDYTFLEASGKGKVVAFVLQGVQDTVIRGPYSYLEGDERIYIDDAQTPFIYGTGTEDIFNGGFYFVLDEFCLPLGGTSNSDENLNRNMYRIYLNDAIYFRKNITANIEHGPINDQQALYHSICFYYWQNDTMFALTDSLDIGKISSENAHQYTIQGQSTIINKSSYFEGSFDKILKSQDGRIVQDAEEFMVKIQPNNVGVRLLRTFDYSLKNQTADVYVNDIFVGTWLNAGSNTIQQFRDDYFAIPQKFTKNESQIKVKIVAKNNWTSLKYKVYTLLEESVPTAKNESVISKISVQLYPNPTHEILNISLVDQLIKTVNIYQMDGKLVQTFQVNDRNLKIAVHQFPKGIYLAEIITLSNDSVTEKFIVE
ncbi:MAG TPA: DUF2961 domain-containing protein [Chitinophagales bacterium]|nr:DUF2961 domain-containing protein [Chitinophagales bacterium]